eukprot:1810993-Amphidinium_carterae.1
MHPEDEVFCQETTCSGLSMELMLFRVVPTYLFGLGFYLVVRAPNNGAETSRLAAEKLNLEYQLQARLRSIWQENSERDAAALRANACDI